MSPNSPAARSTLHGSARIALFLLVALIGTGPVAAQQRPGAQQPDTSEALRRLQQQLGRPVTQAELVERLRQSGMTRAQARARLQQAGYDPAIADQYFDVLERGAEPQRGVAAESSVAALQRIGVTIPGLPALPRDSAGGRGDSLALRDSIRARLLARDSAATDSLEIFGLDVFRGTSSEFQPVEFGPADAGYRVGPGDEIVLVLSGDVETAYTLNVTREGAVVIPDVGSVSVSGLSMEAVETRLIEQLRRVYSGAGRGAGASTRVQVSLGRLRANQIFVVGDVVLPGSKQVSAAGTVLTALYAAGGPTERGSFRRVEVRRGDAIATTVDLYRYLLQGDAASDTRLEHGDRVFVPPAGPRVRLQGAVRRPATYEILPGREGLKDVLAFAGGLQANAVVQRVQIDRILPPGERTPGRYRVVRDVNVGELQAEGPGPALHDGDVVYVHAISDELRERVWITGAVNNPGIFEWSRDLTLAALIGRADGLGENAYRARLQIYRKDPASGRRSMLQAVAPADGDAADVMLHDGDSVVVLNREELRNLESVSIDGFVKEPGEFAYAEGMTVRDLVLAAGGFVPGANVTFAEIARLKDPLARSDTAAHILRVELAAPDDAISIAGAGEWPPSAADPPLQAGDHVFIRRAPGYEPIGQVVLAGQVLYPGTYVLQRRGERITDVLARAGGLTAEAHPEGISVVRGGTAVAADIDRAIQDPQHRSNIALEAGDSIYIPTLDPTVNVTGAVTFASRVLYRPGKSLSYYLEQAGGATDRADARRVTVSYPNGERAQRRGFMGIRRDPAIRPGSTIFVPEKPEQTGFNLDQFLSRTLTIVSTAVTLLVAVNQLK